MVKMSISRKHAAATSAQGSRRRRHIVLYSTMTHPASTTVIKNPTWWRRRTQLERVLTLMTVATIGLCVILTIALALSSYRQYHESASISALQAYGLDKMDPVRCLPPEAMETVWRLLEMRDLLNCRLVSTSWNNCLTSDPVWKRYLAGGRALPFWKSFLESKRLDYNWNNGIYKTYIKDISESQFAIGDNNVYQGYKKKVTCYSPDLIEQYSLEFDSAIVGIHPFGDMVAYVFIEEKHKYKVKIFEKLRLVKEYQTGVNRISVGTKQVCFQKGNTVISFDGKSELVYDLPGDVVELMVINDWLLVKSVSSVFMGSNITFYVHGPEGWQIVWKGRNSPMAYMFCHVEATIDRVAFVGANQTESGYEYSELSVLGREASIVDSIQPSRSAYFRSYSSGNNLIYTQNEALVKTVSTENWKWKQTEVEPGLLLIRSRSNSLILVYQGKWMVHSIGKKYTVPGPCIVDGAIVKEDFLALWSKSSLHIYHFASCSQDGYPSECKPKPLVGA